VRGSGNHLLQEFALVSFHFRRPTKEHLPEHCVRRKAVATNPVDSPSVHVLGEHYGERGKQEPVDQDGNPPFLPPQGILL
jgi:hypothetical protein